MLERYSNIEYINKMPFKRAKALFEKAKAEKEKEELFQMWLTKLPWMSKDDYVSFGDYYKQCKMPKSKKSKEEILKRTEEILQKEQEKHNRNEVKT